MLWEGGEECSRGNVHWPCTSREGEGVQPWGSPQALLGEGGGVYCSRGTAYSRHGRGGEGGEQWWDRPLALQGEGVG